MSATPPPSDRRALLREALEAVEQMQAKLDAERRRVSEPIAIVGMACRFPGAVTTPEAYWTLLREGVDAVSEVPADRWDEAARARLTRGVDGKPLVHYGGFLADIERFDPKFFGISPREAITMDPQQRLVLEVAWEALERAGQAPDRLAGSATGVFLGITTGDYADLVKAAGPEALDVYMATGNAHNAAAGRVSYVLGLNGPSMAVDTACSSSLVAVHLACQSLRTGESRLALAGGVNVILTPDPFVIFSRWGMMAPDGRCKTFDGRADGFVRSEGCGIVVLKRLSDAQADGDEILAIIRGSAVNQDGASSGLTVPNGLAQQAVVRLALRVAGVEPIDVAYVEAHGTGTALGDPIELEALDTVLGAARPAARPLVLGSVKTNLGHLESASGVAGLMKVVLALRHGVIPPNLHFNTLTPRVSLRGPAPMVPTTAVPWPASDGPRLAGVSSFGFSGTNAHVVLEAAPAGPAMTAGANERPVHVLAISARSEPALDELARRYADRLASLTDARLADVCFSAGVGRAHLPRPPSRLSPPSAPPGASRRGAARATRLARAWPSSSPGRAASTRGWGGSSTTPARRSGRHWIVVPKCSTADWSSRCSRFCTPRRGGHRRSTRPPTPSPPCSRSSTR
jgi:acyl transferase domain-containing protein